MPNNHRFDTVAFDVRDNATMLFFARTTEEGDIDDYLLLVRTVEENFDESFYIEINEQQIGGQDVLREVELIGNMLTLRLNEPAEPLGGTEFALTFEETPENLSSIEAGAFRVFGDALVGGRA